MSEETATPHYIPTPEPGVYPDISPAVYHSWDAISNSGLGVIDNESLKHFKWWREHPKPPTKALLTGTAMHALCLEPLEFSRRYAVEPEINARTNEGKKTRADFAAMHKGKTIIEKAHNDVAIPMAKGLRDHHVSREFIRDGKSEVSIVWINKEFGVKCRARLDYLLPRMVVDLKSTRNGDKFAFSRSCSEYGYHRQAAFYTDGASELGLDIDVFAFAAVESKNPYDVVVYAADDAMLMAGRSAYRRALSKYAKALETDCWPGRNEESVEPICVPMWTLKEEGVTQ